MITSLSRKAALAGSQVTFKVTGTTLTTPTTFAFAPASSPAIAVQVVSIDPSGTSAGLQVTSPTGVAGTFALVATNIAGSSSSVITPINRFTVVDPNSRADSDGDGWPDVLEAFFGTDPLDPNSTPSSGFPQGTVASAQISILNNVIPDAGTGSTQEAVSDTFALLNNINPGTVGPQEAVSETFSLLNNIKPVIGGTQEAVSDLFSLLNNISPAPSGSTAREADGPVFSLLNNAGKSRTGHPLASEPAAGQEVPRIGPRGPIVISGMVDSDGDGYPDDLEIALGSDPNDPNSIPEINPPPEADGVVFSIFNDLQPQNQTNLLNNRTKGENHVLKTTHLRKPNIFEKLFSLHRRDTGVRSWRLLATSKRTGIQQRIEWCGWCAHVILHQFTLYDHLRPDDTTWGPHGAGWNLRVQLHNHRRATGSDRAFHEPDS